MLEWKGKWLQIMVNVSQVIVLPNKQEAYDHSMNFSRGLQMPYVLQ